MKKILTLISVGLIVVAAAFSQSASGGFVESSDSYADTSTQVIQVEDKYGDLHQKAKSVKMELEYTPLTGEVRLYYTCLAAAYDQGEAMNTAMAVYEDFAAENKYKHYSYKGKDKTKYFKDENGMRMATYSSYVLFTR
ncbi:hypothetical protein [Treponema sp.]|uniref:hypothetical protein n=1 Tax=Treponema sp. TaxID=166 RepID=UPI0025E3B8B1|nr:hypothetical protein [Treponema sp.]MCR5217281.1 hypothetical protein [Treponema sp.]